MKFLAAILLSLVATPSFARLLNKDCAPSGIVNKAKALASPNSFWVSALSSIDQEVQSEYTRIRLERIDDARSRVNEEFDKQEMRAKGIPPDSDPALARDLAESEALMRSYSADQLRRTKAWADKCRIYANDKLSNSQ